MFVWQRSPEKPAAHSQLASPLALSTQRPAFSHVTVAHGPVTSPPVPSPALPDTPALPLELPPEPLEVPPAPPELSPASPELPALPSSSDSNADPEQALA